MRPDSVPACILALLRLRGGPQDLPYSHGLLWKLILLSLLLDMVASHWLAAQQGSVLRILVVSGFSLLLPWWLLSWAGKRARFVQTLSALLATGIVLSLVFLPLAVWAIDHGMAKPDATPTPQQAMLAWLILIVVVWKVMVTAHIWRQALEWPLAGGVAVSVALMLLELGFDRLLWGAGWTY